MLEAVCRNNYTVNLKIFVNSSLDGRWFNTICDYNWVMASLFIIIAYPAHLHSHSTIANELSAMFYMIKERFLKLGTSIVSNFFYVE